MKCPICSGKTGISNSRTSKLGDTRRRRDCDKCGHRFTTYEVDMSAVLMELENILDTISFEKVEQMVYENYPTCDTRHFTEGNKHGKMIMG